MTSFPKKHILQNEGRNYQPKKLFKVKKKECDSEGQETFAFILFIDVLINNIVEVYVLVTMTKKKLR